MGKYQKGAAALDALNATNSGGGNDAEITPFKSGTVFKVRVKDASDLMNYFNYGIYKKVNSFVPQNPSTRDEKGFVVADHTPWDLASKYYFDQARKASKDEEEDLKAEGRQYKGSEKFLLGFYDLSSGKDIIVDLTKNQALSVYGTIKEYAEIGKDGRPVPGGEHEFEEMAFKLSKKGESTSTVVTLNPIVNISKGLTEEEQKNFEASEGQKFDESLFDNVLYEADEDEQVELLKQAGFDPTLIGYGAKKAESESKAEETAENSDDTPIDISDDDLPF